MATQGIITDTIRDAVAADTRTQRQIAAASGLHATSLNRWLRGRLDLSGRHLDRLAETLGLQLTQHRRKKRETKQ